MNEMTEQSPESVNIDIEEQTTAPETDAASPEETEIDLNAVFPEEESDLNDLFPDEETRLLLKRIQRTKKDLATMTDRFTEEDWSGDGPADSSSPTASETTDTPETTEPGHS